jgi:hypothetical protein
LFVCLSFRFIHWRNEIVCRFTTSLDGKGNLRSPHLLLI